MGSTGLHNLYYDLPEDLQEHISRLSFEALPHNLEDYISRLNLEASPLFVAQKLLTVSDINQSHNSLRLPKRLINAEFLEKFLAEYDNEQLETNCVQLNLVDNMMREYKTMHMRKWGTKLYVLTRGWHDVVLQNKLKAVEVLKDSEVETKLGMVDDNKLLTDVVARIWCFRRESSIWFALNIQALTEVKILGRTEEGHYIIE